MQNLNSDQLRKLLKNHTRKMNWIAEQNDLIVAALKQRGLQPVEFERLSDVFGAGGEIVFKKKPLTVDELKTGVWWMASATQEDAKAFLDKKLSIFDCGQWGACDGFDYSCSSDGNHDDVARCYINHPTVARDKQIHRIGNEFYWGAPSDQAN